MSSPSFGATASAGPAGRPVQCSRLDDDALGGRLFRTRPRRLGALVPGEEEAGRRIGQVERDLALLEQHVHRHDDAARAQDAVVGDRELRDVREHQADGVAVAQAELAQPGGHAGAGRVELAHSSSASRRR